jgi:Tol biopolymer transport system component
MSIDLLTATRRVALGLLIAGPLLLAACAGSDGDDGDDERRAVTSTSTAVIESQLIVYEARGSVPEDPNSTDIYTIDPATGETKRLTNDGSSRHPAWSPDHSEIVYASDAGEADSQEEIYIMRGDGSNVRRLTTTPGISEWHPRISPDGTRIAYMSIENDIGFVKVMNVDGTGDERVSEQFKLLRSGVWSPDGTEIFFSGLKLDDTQFDIFSVNVETGEMQLRIGTEFSEACPHVTHDGRTLTYGNVFEEEDGTMNIDIFAHDLEDGDASGESDERLTDDLSVDDYGDPDEAGRLFVFVSRRDENPELYVLDRETSAERRLTTTVDLDEDNPDW